MGKRKKSSRKPQGPKKKEPLPTTFACLFCNHEKSITVKLDKKAGTGQLSCKVCGQQFQTGINYLSAAVDVYSDWIDACDTVAKEEASGRAPASGRAGYSGLVSSRRGDDEDEDLDGYAESGGGDGFIDDEHDPGHAASEAD